MNKKTIYILLVVAVLGVVGLYYYNKYNVAPAIDVTKLEVVDQDTVLFDIASLKGKKVIISFYASWCGNCLEELKTLNSIKDTKLSDVTVLAITDEDMDKLVSFKNATQYPFTFLTITKRFNDIGIFSIPTVYLLNTKGEVVYNNVGYVDWDDESTLNHLRSLME